MIAVGTKDGDLDKKEDVRMPDSEAWFSGLHPAAKKPALIAIEDPMQHARRWQTLATEGGRSLFARVADDSRRRRAVARRPAGEARARPAVAAVRAEEPDLRGRRRRHGVESGSRSIRGTRRRSTRKKADADYFDVFRVDGTTATRVGRVLAPKARFAIGATAGQVWLLERNVGFDRGGKTLTFYSTGS